MFDIGFGEVIVIGGAAFFLLGKHKDRRATTPSSFATYPGLDISKGPIVSCCEADVFLWDRCRLHVYLARIKDSNCTMGLPAI